MWCTGIPQMRRKLAYPVQCLTQVSFAPLAALHTEPPKSLCRYILTPDKRAALVPRRTICLSLSLSPTISLGTIYDHVHIDSLRSRLSRSRFEKERLYTGTTLNLRLRAGPYPSAANNLENHSPCQPLHPNTVPLFTSDEHSKFFHSGRIPETLTTAKTSTDTGEPAAAILEHIEPWREKGLQPAAG